MKELVADEHHGFSIRENTWDSRAFGYVVSEVIGLRYEDPAFLARIDEENERMGAAFCVLRQHGFDLRVKQDLIQRGFYLAETSIDAKARLKSIKSKSYFSFRQAEERHLEALRTIVSRDFHHGRFHEDPHVDQDAVKVRYRNWVNDLVAENKCWVAETSEGQVIGFFAYDLEGDRVKLTLAGIDSDFHGYGMFFFYSMIEHVKPLAKTATAMISAANLPVMNLYAKLGFDFSDVYLGFHKICK